MASRRLTLAAVIAALIQPASTSGQSIDQGNARRGFDLYQDNCASCHGADLEGQENWQSRREDGDGTYPAPPHDASGHTWHHDDAMLFEYTKLGGQVFLDRQGVTDFKSGMPAFGETLSEQQILDILAFIRSTWPKPVRRAQEKRNANAD